LELVLDLFIKLAVIIVIMGMASLAAAWALLRGFKPRAVVLTGTLTLVLFFSALFLLVQSNLKQETLPLFQQYFQDSWKTDVQILTQRGFSKEDIDLYYKNFYQKYVFYSFPAWLVMICLFMGLIAYYLSSSILSRVTARVSRPIAFKEWIVPEPLVFGLILGGLLKIVFKENSPLDIVGDNLLVFFLIFYSLTSLSIVSFFFQKWKFSPFMRMISYAIIFLSPVSGSICCLSILDIWFDFRKLKSPPAEPIT
jgi:uncharacterized protein YybS (DUF2232 family)